MLTFLFTDIEASTRRWEEDPLAMASALTRHDDLLRSAIEGHGGTVFKHTGDGCCATFPTASAALSAAVDSQLSLGAEDWGAKGPLRVRMALHTGAAEARGGDYFGPTLNRVARLMATAHGAQIVLSLATEESVGDGLPPDVTLVDLGEHRLADLARPERVFQVVHPRLPSAFPPLRSAHRHNLPSAVSRFVGRRSELQEVGGLLAGARLVTLTGVGGAGKTRLALEAAAEALAGFPDGVFVVELAALSDPSLVPGQVAAALGMAVEGVQTAADVVERLRQYLETRRVFLLLDNCEHLLSATAELVGVLLGGCPRLVVLATSREPLGLQGEVRWRVPSLTLPPREAVTPEAVAVAEAVALFCDRARAADPRFDLTAQNAEAVAQICRQLDGIPLALELAAARIRLLSPPQMAERLGDRFRLLTGGARTAIPRHQTLKAALDWSYQLLSDQEQALLRRFSVFAGGFSLEAAEAVGADGESLTGGEILDLVGHLVDKSLIDVGAGEDEVRYRLLETVRQYGAERLADAGETEVTHRRHRDFFLTLADAANSERDPWANSRQWMHWCRTDQANFRSALEWSWAAGEPDACLRLGAALFYYWVLEGHLLEGQTWLARALTSGVGQRTSVQVQALNALGFLVLQSGDATQSAGLHEEALAMAGVLGDRVGAGEACYLLGERALRWGELDRAEELLERAHQDFATAGRNGGVGWCCFNLGWLALAKGDDQQARTRFEHTLALGRRAGADDLVAQALAALAPLSALAGDAGRAEALGDEAVEIARRLGLRRFLVMALTRAAEAAILVGRHGRAAPSLRESLMVLRDIGGRAWVVDSLQLVALVRAADGHYEAAARLLGGCEALCDAWGEHPGLASLRDETERCRAEAARALGPEVLAAEWSRGEEMSADEALADAVRELRPDEAPSRPR